MKYVATIISLTTLLLLFFITSSVKASVYSNVQVISEGDTSSSVNLENTFNSSTSDSYSSKTETNLKMKVEGNGTARVNINGKEWKLDGPGEINVDESSGSDSTNLTPTPQPNSSPTVSVTPTEDLENVLGDSDEDTSSLAEIVNRFLKSIQGFFSKLFRKN